MGLPTKAKTWTIDSNNVGVVTDDISIAREVVFTLKEALVTAGWSVTSSCDSLTVKNFGDGSPDLWIDRTKIIRSASSDHSWIVLEHPSVPISFSMAFRGSYDYSMDFGMSRVGYGVANGGADGTTTARPTSTAERFLDNTSIGLGRTSSTRIVHHFWYSSDDACFRFWSTSNGSSQGSLFIFIDVPDSPPDLWTNPWYCIHLLGSGVKSQMTVANLYSDYNETYAFVGNPNYNMYLSGESCGGGNSPLCQFDDVNPSDLSSDAGYLMQPVGLAGRDANVRGSNGRVFDCWWAPYESSLGDTFPNDSSRQFICIGDIVLPWDGTVPVLE